MTDPTELSATALAAAIRARRISATEAVAVYLERIGRLNPELNAVIYLDADRALAAAGRADAARRRSGRLGRLHGVPMTLKDSHRVAGMPTVVGNPEASRTPAARDGVVAARLRAAGAILLGKSNVPRDLADSQTDNPVFGRTNNPSDPSRTPGGSSGGAAAALAAHLTPLEVGSDIAGSVRLPAAFTGVIGLRPTAGLISRQHHVTEPIAHPRGGGVGALVGIGPMARDFNDLALLLEILCGVRRRPRFDPAATRIGVIEALPGLRVESAIREAIASLAHEAARGGAMRVAAVETPPDPAEQHAAWVAVYRAAEASGSAWRRTAPEAARAADHARAAWDAVLRLHDAVLLPAAMCLPFTHRPTGSPIEVDGVPTPYWGLVRYTEPFSLTGHPAIAFPIGVTAGGLPVGAQLVGRHGSDAWLVRAAQWLSGRRGMHQGRLNRFETREKREETRRG